MFMKNYKKNQWFFEKSEPYSEIKTRFGIKIKKKLYSGKSRYQKIEIFDSYDFGKILALDGILQTTERDEFFYHEMLCQIPLFSHKNPKEVLIIGGGDGGALREVLKHPIEKVWMVEIDKKVIEVSKKYLPSISKGAFEDKRAKIIIDDGWHFVKKYKDFFDVIILDLPDPWGPAQNLISLRFYQNIKKVLKEKGVVSIQSGSFFEQPQIVSTIYRRLKKVPFFIKVHRGCVPLYGIGEFSFTIAAKFDLEKVDLKNIKKRFKKISLKTKYYSPEIHQSSAVLPQVFKELFF